VTILICQPNIGSLDGASTFNPILLSLCGRCNYFLKRSPSSLILILTIFIGISSY